MRSENHTTRPCTLSLDEERSSVAALEQPCGAGQILQPPPFAAPTEPLQPGRAQPNARPGARQSQSLKPSALEPASSASPFSPIKIAPCMNVAPLSPNRIHPLTDCEPTTASASPLFCDSPISSRSSPSTPRDSDAKLRHDTTDTSHLDLHRRPPANFTQGCRVTGSGARASGLQLGLILGKHSARHRRSTRTPRSHTPTPTPTLPAREIGEALGRPACAADTTPSPTTFPEAVSAVAADRSSPRLHPRHPRHPLPPSFDPLPPTRLPGRLPTRLR